MLESLRVRKAIMSVAAVNDEGFFNNNLMLVETERAMMEAADEAIVVADSTKFGHQSLAHVCELGAVGTLVVDDGISQEWRDKVVAAGVELLVAATAEHG
jgi:DeoR/GlpR family transcriptional regulator of sugar metabolism